MIHLFYLFFANALFWLLKTIALNYYNAALEVKCLQRHDQNTNLSSKDKITQKIE